MRMTLKDWFRAHFADAQVYSLYLTIPVKKLGRIVAEREQATGMLFSQARIASTIPSSRRKARLSLEEIENALRRIHPQLFKNVLAVLPSARVTESDPVQFVYELQRLWQIADTDSHPEINLVWSAEQPRDYIASLLRSMGRTTKEIYSSANPDRLLLSPDDPAQGVVIAPPKVLDPRVGEIPALLLYALSPI